ncbi:MAG: hypothetical protein HYZ21_05550 [Chloroflexi bacterium]|nr:hypothetical protein [Chloroflexota bacterium]
MAIGPCPLQVLRELGRWGGMCYYWPNWDDPSDWQMLIETESIQGGGRGVFCWCRNKWDVVKAHLADSASGGDISKMKVLREVRAGCQ